MPMTLNETEFFLKKKCLICFLRLIKSVNSNDISKLNMNDVKLEFITDLCELSCDRYYSCETIAEANDFFVEKEKEQDMVNSLLKLG